MSKAIIATQYFILISCMASLLLVLNSTVNYHNNIYSNYTVCNNTSIKDMYIVNLTGDSMKPTIMPGSRVYLKEIPANESIAVGSIVSANNPARGAVVGHRVISVDVDRDVIVLRGDNNYLEDSYRYRRSDINFYVCGVLY
jgi:hypothetical protein